jgi:hypothetical protein
MSLKLSRRADREFLSFERRKIPLALANRVVCADGEEKRKRIAK